LEEKKIILVYKRNAVLPAVKTKKKNKIKNNFKGSNRKAFRELKK